MFCSALFEIIELKARGLKFTAKDVYMKPPGIMDSKTSHKNDYIAHQVQPTRSMKPQASGPGNEVPFEGNPTYKEDYKLWPFAKPEAIKKDKMYVPPSAAMENQTTNKIDFIPLGLPHTKSFKPDNMAMVSNEPFDDLTNHRINYINHPLPEKVYRAKDEYKPSKSVYLVCFLLAAR